MRELIRQPLEVIAMVEKSRPKNHTDVNSGRISATLKVADAHGIDRRTVYDKYQRQLLGGRENFGELLADWLLDGSRRLMQVLLNRAESDDETDAIQKVFRRPT